MRISLHGRAVYFGCFLLLLISPSPGHAQEEQTVPGVSLGFQYDANSYIPPIGILPFEGRFGAEAAASQVAAIIARDLRYSDRFTVLDSLPSLSGQGVDYSLWDQIGADWLLTGSLEGAGQNSVLVLELHDVVFSDVKQTGRFPLPDPNSDGFRMAVHRVSDQVVEWVHNEPGMAASQVVFAMRPYGDAEPYKELYIVDSDGENLKRLTFDQGSAASPTWAPDGERIAYTSWRTGIPLIYERNLLSGRETRLDPNRTGQQITPAYHPDGRQIAFSLMSRDRSGLFSYNLGENCCLSHLSGGRNKDLQPTFSPDGRRVAFTSNRLGTSVPQIYVMSAQGGEAELLSPYRFGEGGHFTDPDWSPTSSQVAFAGRIKGQRIVYHILVADVATGDSKLRQLTREGDNQDPSWGPDGRHIVFTGERSYGHGIFIVDSVTGRLRTLVSSVEAHDTDWSFGLKATEVRGGGRGAGRLR